MTLAALGPAPQVTLMGVSLDALTEHEVVARILDDLRERRGGWMVNPNVDVLRQIVSRPDLAELVAASTLAVADGMPLVWASSLQGTPLPERVAGSTLISVLAGAARAEGIPVLLLGAGPGVAERAAERLRRDWPGLCVVWHTPPQRYEDDPTAFDEIVAVIEGLDPAVCFLAFGFPRQEQLIARLRPRFPQHWFVAAGASLDFLAGRVQRAPRPVQRLGLEWLWRLASEPRRLFRRYIIDDLPFAGRMMVAALGERRSPRRKNDATVQTAVSGVVSRDSGTL